MRHLVMYQLRMETFENSRRRQFTLYYTTITDSLLQQHTDVVPFSGYMQLQLTCAYICVLYKALFTMSMVANTEQEEKEQENNLHKRVAKLFCSRI